MNRQIINRDWIAFSSGSDQACVALDCVAGFEENGYNETLVHLTGGQSIDASMSIEEFKTLMMSTNA